jgi:uncharacterized membrane protein YgcG
MRTLASGIALLLLAAPAHAQTTPDSRWSRWTGCWDMVMENSREGAPSPTATRESRTPAQDAGRPQVCVVATPDGGATFSTRVGTQTPIVQTVVPDGKDRPIAEDECKGTQRTEWSSDGLRLFAHAELTCKGDPATRRVSGLALIGPDGRWTDVQSVDIADRESFRVRQYRRANGGVATMPNVAATALTLADVKEASAKVSPRALEAALVETRASFDLTSKSLLDLNAAGVPASVVDLMVALSYPDRFVIERSAQVDRAQAPIINDPFMLGWAFGYPVWSDVYGLYSPLYGAYSPYYYSPFAYPYLRGYYPNFYGSSYVIDGGGGGGGVADRPSGLGRVVDGQGYTRVRPRESEPAVASRGSAPSGSSSSSGGGSSSSSSGSSGGGSVSSSGFSSGGGGGGDGGRSAQPR